MTTTAFQWSSSGTPEVSRTFAATTGVTQLYFRMRASETNIDHIIRLQTSGVAERIVFKFDSAGNMNANGTTIQAYSANTTYVIGFKWGHNGNNYAVSVNGGAYSSDVALGGVDMNNWIFGGGANATYVIDDISVGPFVPLNTGAGFLTFM